MKLILVVVWLKTYSSCMILNIKQTILPIIKFLFTLIVWARKSLGKSLSSPISLGNSFWLELEWFTKVTILLWSQLHSTQQQRNINTIDNNTNYSSITFRILIKSNTYRIVQLHQWNSRQKHSLHYYIK